MSVYLTAADVAETLGVSTRTVLRWIDRGDLEAVRLPGGRLRVAPAALAARVASWSTMAGRMDGGILPCVCPSEEE